MEISPDGQTLVLAMPDDARPVAFDYYIDDGRSGVRANALVSVDVRDPGSNSAPAPREGYRRADLPGAAPGRPCRAGPLRLA